MGDNQVRRQRAFGCSCCRRSPLNHFRQFQPAPKPKDAHVGVVKEFHSPAAPSAAAVPSGSDLAKEIEAYEASSPAEAAAPAQSAAAETPAQGETADDFLEGLKADLKHDAHH